LFAGLVLHIDYSIGIILLYLLLLTKTIDSFIVYREQLLQDQLQSAKESVSNMKKLHELAQNQLFELRAQSGNQIVLKSGHTLMA
jgi:F0F1-type ATP synthase membrane subunit b/b'